MRQRIIILTSVFFFIFATVSDGVCQWETNIALFSRSGFALKIFAGNLYAGGVGGIEVSKDTGTTWKTLSLSRQSLICAIDELGGKLFAGVVDSGIFLSNDSGKNWKTLGGGLKGTVRSIAICNGSIYASMEYNGMFVSRDTGFTWKPITNGLGTNKIYSIVTVDTDVFAATNGGIFTINNHDTIWNLIANGSYYSISSSDSILYRGSYAEFSYSTNHGLTWVTPSNKGLKYFTVYDIYSSGENIFAGTDNSVLFSSDKGESWVKMNGSIYIVLDLITFGQYLFATSRLGQTGGLGVCRYPLAKIALNKVVSTNNTTSIISLSPNPTTGIITVQNAEQNISHITVSNILGEQMLELVKPNAPEFTIDLSKFPAGTYLATFATASGIVTKKIIKE